jgi:hypothetical protein
MDFDTTSSQESAQTRTKGIWYLVYDDFDSLENHNPVRVMRVELPGVLSEEEAVRAAIANCPMLQTFRGYDNEMYPRNARVIYEISLVAKFQLCPKGQDGR